VTAVAVTTLINRSTEVQQLQLTVSWMGVNGKSNANRLHTEPTNSLWDIFTQS